MHRTLLRLGSFVTIAGSALLACTDPAPHAEAAASSPWLSANVPAHAWSVPGPCEVAKSDETWRDEQRGREVPVRIYVPENVDTPRPLLIYSHGGGGNRNVGAYLATRLASHGFVVIAPQHLGSDTAVLRGDERGLRALRGARKRLQKMIEDPDNLRNRPLDVSFVIDRALAGDLPRGVKIEQTRIGALGHSFGAYTVMAGAGMLIDLPEDQDHSFRDPRIRCVIAMSPQGVGQMGIDGNAWAEIAVPVMGITGTRDTGAGGQDASWRRTWFDAMADEGPDAPIYLAVIADATHMAFSDDRDRDADRRRARGRGKQRDERHHAWIQALATAFFKASLLGDADAARWLRDAEIEDETNAEVQLETAGL
jgi:predicted dienelactone hydrolase